MEDLMFNTVNGQTIKRELMIAYLNTGNAAVPVWSPLGKRVTDSSESLDWSEDSSTDILGNAYTTFKKPQITQTFDPYNLDAGDPAIVKLWNLAVKDQDYTALTSQDVLIVHLYAGTSDTAMFAERYSGCAIRPTSLGGEGGGNMAMPLEISYGGARTVGTAAISAGAVTFTPAADSGLPKLSALTLTGATSITFDADTVDYSTAATASTGTVTATAATQGSTLVILHNGNSIASGGTVTWAEGENVIAVTVSYGGSSNTYVVRVTYTP